MEAENLGSAACWSVRRASFSLPVVYDVLVSQGETREPKSIFGFECIEIDCSKFNLGSQYHDMMVGLKEVTRYTSTEKV